MDVHARLGAELLVQVVQMAAADYGGRSPDVACKFKAVPLLVT